MNRSLVPGRRLARRIAFALLLLAFALPARAIATELPRQLLFLPLPIPPGPDEPAMPLRLVGNVLRLPDGRDAQLWRLSWWVRAGDAHRVGVAFDYVGIEGEQLFRWGGGAARLQWSSRLGAIVGRPLEIDLEGNLPHGDESLHPLSAKAPAVQARIRMRAITVGSWQLTTAWWARRVSPPSERVRIAPNEVFPSGSGVDVLLRRVTGHGDAELVVQRPLAGLPEATWVHLRVDLPLAADLAVTAGAMAGIGPTAKRPIDHGFALGLTWRPAPRERAPDEDGGGRF
jgi:hypothetical protein